MYIPPSDLMEMRKRIHQKTKERLQRGRKDDRTALAKIAAVFVVLAICITIYVGPAQILVMLNKTGDAIIERIVAPE